MNLSIKNNMDKIKKEIKTFFTGLEFNEEQHTYNVKSRYLTSVSKTISKYVEHVDFDMIAGFVAKKRTKETGIYTTKAMILAEWEAKKNNSCTQGTNVHLFGETYVKGMRPTNGFESAIVKFWDSIPDHIQPFLFEIQMFSEELGIAGTADIILYNTKTNKFILADYKTNEDLFKNFKGKKLLAPFDNLLENSFNKYQLQLSMYQLLFEQCGYEIESRRVIWLKPDGSFENLKTEDYTHILKNELTKF